MPEPTMPSQPLPKKTVEKVCPVGMDCGARDVCSDAFVHEECGIYQQLLIKAAKLKKS